MHRRRVSRRSSRLGIALLLLLSTAAVATIVTLASLGFGSEDSETYRPRVVQVASDGIAVMASSDDAEQPDLAPTPLAETQSEPRPIAESDEPDPQPGDQGDGSESVRTEPESGLVTCATSDLPAPEGAYVVDTNSASLKHRSSPTTAADVRGESAPSTRGLLPTGQCVRNLNDGFTWWQIDRDGDRFWVASEFLTLDD